MADVLPGDRRLIAARRQAEESKTEKKRNGTQFGQLCPGCVCALNEGAATACGPVGQGGHSFIGALLMDSSSPAELFLKWRICSTTCPRDTYPGRSWPVQSRRYQGKTLETLCKTYHQLVKLRTTIHDR